MLYIIFIILSFVNLLGASELIDKPTIEQILESKIQENKQLNSTIENIALKLLNFSLANKAFYELCDEIYDIQDNLYKQPKIVCKNFFENQKIKFIKSQVKSWTELYPFEIDSKIIQNLLDSIINHASNGLHSLKLQAKKLNLNKEKLNKLSENLEFEISDLEKALKLSKTLD